jgi:hypothetical protein
LKSLVPSMFIWILIVRMLWSTKPFFNIATRPVFKEK